MSHTKGPWRVEGRRTFGPSTGARDITHTVVSVPHPNGAWEVIGVRSANEEADAHLISAAPDLLEALENLTIAVGMGWDLDGVIAAAEAAIKKARGEK